ncbi:MAG TPA: choice-of-anchor P family protein [Acidimicrobiia bacterium]
MRILRKQALVAGVVVAAALGLAPLTASAEPIDISGDASGLTVQVDVLGTPINVGPLPIVTAPPGGNQQVVGADVPGVASADVLGVSSQPTATGVDSAAQVAGAEVLGGVVSAGVLTATCSSTPDGSAGGAALVDASVLGTPVDVSPPANTQVPLPGLGAVYLNEQVRSDAPGSSSMTVNAVRVALTGGLTLGGITISHASCSATDLGIVPGGATVSGPGGGGAPVATAVTASPAFTG